MPCSKGIHFPYASEGAMVGVGVSLYGYLSVSSWPSGCVSVCVCGLGMSVSATSPQISRLSGSSFAAQIKGLALEARKLTILWHGEEGPHSQDRKKKSSPVQKCKKVSAQGRRATCKAGGRGTAGSAIWGRY